MQKLRTWSSAIASGITLRCLGTDPSFYGVIGANKRGSSTEMGDVIPVVPGPSIGNEPSAGQRGVGLEESKRESGVQKVYLEQQPWRFSVIRIIKISTHGVIQSETK